MSLDEVYRQVSRVHSDVRDHIPVFLRTVEELDAKKVIEVGVRYGLSTVAWLYALQNRGQLWAVDCSFPTVGPEIPFNVLDSQGPLGVQPHWVFILGDAHSPIVQGCLPKNADIIFLDTNHVYEETLLELDIYAPLIRTGGRILLHDTNIEDTGNRGDRPKTSYPVRTAVEEWCALHDKKYDFFDAGCGLGTIYF